MDLCVDRSSWLHRLDPRTKVAFTVVGSVLLLLTTDLLAVGVWLLATQAVLLGARVPLARFRWAWRALVPLTAMVFIFWPLFYRDGLTVLLDVGPIRVTLESLVRGAAVALRLDALAFVWFVLLFSTEQTRLVQGLVRLGLPHAWGLTVAIALRYLPALQENYVMVYQAQQARGFVARGRLLGAARAQLPILVAVLIGALRTTDQLTLALQARAFSPGAPRTSRRELRLARADYLALGVMLVVVVGYACAAALR